MLASEIFIPSRKIKYGLERTFDFLELCKNPEKNLFSVQIIGTNGKGTVAAFITQILIDAGYKVGTYSSPHLVEINERIKINNQHISDKDIKYFLNKFYKKANKIEPSFFELLTVMAMWYFNKKKVEIAVLETGLGGRYDSVTACKNQILGFTPIAMDHHEILGNTIKKIALEKSKAIKDSQQRCISINQGKTINNILTQQANKSNNTISIIRHNQEKFILKNLYGEQNQENAQLAKRIILILNSMNKTRISTKNINKSIYNTQWYGRFQILQKKPTIIYDVAHNTLSLNCFLKSFLHFTKKNLFTKKHIIIAFENNKKIRTAIKKYTKHFNYITCTETNIRSSMPCQEMAKIFDNKATYNQDLEKTLLKTIKTSNVSDCIVIIGSHFIAPTINKIFKNCFVQKYKQY